MVKLTSQIHCKYLMHLEKGTVNALLPDYLMQFYYQFISLDKRVSSITVAISDQFDCLCWTKDSRLQRRKAAELKTCAS